MKLSNQNNNTHFTSIRICPVNLCKIKKGHKIGFEQAFITMLDDKNIKDLDVVKNLQKLWLKNSLKLELRESNLVKRETEGLCENFIKLNKSQTEGDVFSRFYNPNHKRIFLAIEKPGKSPLESRIIGFTKIRDHFEHQEEVEGAFIVVNPLELVPKKRTLSGIGETLFAKTIQIVKAGNYKNFVWKSDNDSYYFHILKKAGIDLNNVYNGWSEFNLPKEFFNNFLNYFDKKYNMNFSNSPIEQEFKYFHRKT